MKFLQNENKNIIEKENFINDIIDKFILKI